MIAYSYVNYLTTNLSEYKHSAIRYSSGSSNGVAGVQAVGAQAGSPQQPASQSLRELRDSED